MSTQFIRGGSTRIRFNCLTPRDNMPERDALGNVFAHISPREIVLAPGNAAHFGFVDHAHPHQPASNNLLSHNYAVDPIHADVTPGEYCTSIMLTDVGAASGTFVNHKKNGADTAFYERLEKWTPVEVESGALIRLAEHPFIATVGGRQLVCAPPVWQLVVEPVDPAYDEKCRVAAERPPFTRESMERYLSGSPKSAAPQQPSRR